MSIKKVKWFYLSFIPPLLFSTDFIPVWYTYINIFILLLCSLIKLPKLLSYINFINIYFIFTTVELRLIPETAVPCLGIFIISQLILGTSIKNDAYLLFLWCGAFAIFNPTLYYLAYIFFCLIVMYRVLDTNQNQSFISSLKTFYKYKVHLILGLAFAVLLFIFFPRFYNFLPTSNSVSKGQVGYSKEINNSQMGEISLSSQSAFFAETNQKIDIKNMYWRGRVLDTTSDGYNWKSSSPPPTKATSQLQDSTDIKYRVKYEQDFDEDIILLDSPISAKSLNGRIYKIESTNTYKTYVKQKKVYIEAISSLQKNLNQQLSKNLKNHFLKMPINMSSAFQEFINNVKSDKPAEIIKNFENKIIADKYTYTLAPGRMPTIDSFLGNKKGYCTHYAALLTSVLRYLNIPARIITGFQGGKYNDVGEFYEIKSNDAHAWVEFFDKNKWKRVDPTSFISPERIQLGGQDFLTNTKPNQNTNFFLASFNRLRLFVETLNYEFSLLVENFDRDKQRGLSKWFHLDLKTFFKFGAALGLSTLFLFYLYIGRSQKNKVSEIDKILIKYESKLLKMKLIKAPLSQQKTIQSMKEQVMASDYDDDIYKFINAYEITKYSHVNKFEELIEILEKKLV